MTEPMLPPPPVDLATLLGEMAALKAEVRAETRASRELRERLGGVADELAGELERARAREERLRAELAQLGDAARGPEVRRLLDLLDRLEALARAGTPTPRRRFWRRRAADAAVGALVEGLRLTAARVEEALFELGVTRIRTAAAALDPHRMEAVGTARQPDRPALAVLEEVASGWLAGERVVRPAKVIVNNVDNSGVGGTG